MWGDLQSWMMCGFVTFEQLLSFRSDHVLYKTVDTDTWKQLWEVLILQHRLLICSIKMRIYNGELKNEREMKIKIWINNDQRLNDVSWLFSVELVGTKKERGSEAVCSRGYILFLLTPARMEMAAASPVRSSFRLGWRIEVCNPYTPAQDTTLRLTERKTETGRHVICTILHRVYHLTWINICWNHWIEL